MKIIQKTLINMRTREVVADVLEAADGFFSRFAGLQLRADLRRGRGLILVPCGSVHTFFMRFDLDLVMLDRSGKVLGVRRGVRPWRIAVAPPQTYAVLEVRADNLPAVQTGDRLFFEEGPSSGLPKSLFFLAEKP